MKHKNRKKRVIDIAIILTTTAAIICVIMAVRSYSEYRRGNDVYLDAAASFLVTGVATDIAEAEDTAASPNDPVEPDESGAKAAESSEETADDRPAPETDAAELPLGTAKPPALLPEMPVSVDFDALRRVNGDVSAWIASRGTPINYPVVSCETEEDYDYYIKHLFDGRRNKLGTLFIDARNTPFEDNNTIIYGHNMLNGTMFSDLLRYRKQSYYDSHPAMKLYTPRGDYDILLFSGYMTTDKSESYTLNLSGEAFEQYIADAIAASDFKSDVRPGADSRIVTLSTCDNRTSDKRYVVHGLLREIQ